jgi:transcriptional regulator with XRE-family HTH domain
VSVSAATMCHMPTPEIASASEIGRRILAAREALRLSQQDFADRAGLSRAYISRLERGLIPSPTLTDLGKVAEAAGTSVVDLTMVKPVVTQTRFSHEWDELQSQTEGLPDEIREQVIRGFLESVAILHSASGLARRN